MRILNIFSTVIIIVLGVTAQETLDRSCTKDSDCGQSDGNVVCKIGWCTCGETTIRANFPARCLPIPKTKNDPCEDDLQCTEAFLLGSYCGESSRCDCYPQYIFSNEENICVRREGQVPTGTAGIDDSCGSNHDCAVEGSYCKTSHCACEEDRVASTDKKKCLQLAKKINDPCVENIQCTESLSPGSQCQDGRCVCRTTYHFSSVNDLPNCYKTININEPCTDVNECTAKPAKESVACLAGGGGLKCQCVPPYKPTSDNTLCTKGGGANGNNGPATAQVGIISIIVTATLAKLLQ